MGLKETAQQTVAALESGHYTAPDGRIVDFSALLKRCLDGTRCYQPDELAAIRDRILASPPAMDRTEIELVNETTLQGVARMVATQRFQHIAALNFASARNPGGGFLGEARAQEESLARSSGLYASLICCPEFYAFHRAQRTCLYSDRMIFSPHCPILRTDRGEWLDSPRVVSFITSPAPNAGAIRQNEPDNLAKIPEAFRERIGKLLALAAHQGCDALILGAWGCGAFRNNPRMVADAFWEYLKPGGPFRGRVARILFSVLDTSPDRHIYSAFARHFDAATS